MKLYYTFIVILGMSLVILYMGAKMKKLENRLKLVEPIVKAVESSKDVIYSYRMVPYKKYDYLSESVDRILGEGAYKEHIENPDYIYSIVHLDDLPLFLQKVEGSVDFDEALKYRILHKDGHYIWLEEFATPIYDEDGQLVAMHGIYRDISNDMVFHDELKYKLRKDSLTDLNNRLFFDELFERYNVMEDEAVALIICDIDKLKNINDSHGHEAGDRYIKDVAKLLKTFEAEDLYATRIGGDEFALFLVGQRVERLELLLEDIQAKIGLYQGEFQIEMSIGYAKVDQSIGNLGEIFKEADCSMYAQKTQRNTGRGNLHV